MLLLILVQLSRMSQGQPDIVETFEQAELAEGINVKLCRETLAVCHCLIGERNR